MLLTKLQQAKKQLRESGISSWALDAELLLCKALHQTREYLLRGEGELSASQQSEFEHLLKRRMAREPMSHLLGVREFWGRDFVVTNDVLDPRADSETLIEEVLKHFADKTQPLNVLDLGTGSGCLLLTILSEYQNAHGVGGDISAKALAVAQQNAENLGVNKRSKWLNQDAASLCDVSQYHQAFDVVITNPPYIPSQDIETLETEVKSFEPMLALDGGDDGYDCYQAFAPVIAYVLKPNGLAVIEAGIGQAQTIAKIMENAGLQLHSIEKDLAGIERAVVLMK